MPSVDLDAASTVNEFHQIRIRKTARFIIELKTSYQAVRAAQQHQQHHHFASTSMGGPPGGGAVPPPPTYPRPATVHPTTARPGIFRTGFRIRIRIGYTFLESLDPNPHFDPDPSYIFYFFMQKTIFL